MKTYTMTKLSATIISILLVCTIIGIPLAVIMAQLNALIELAENK